jgi:hypothetical protein
VGALVSILLWIKTQNPLLAVELAVVIGALGFIPTFYKAFSKPQEETLATFFMNALKFIIAIFALTTFSPVTLLYPSAMVFMNISLGSLIAFRRM